MNKHDPSSPYRSTRSRLVHCHRGPESVAQLVEQYTFNVWVAGSIPARLTTSSAHQKTVFEDDAAELSGEVFGLDRYRAVA